MSDSASQTMTGVKDYRWAKIFIEIALRAMRRVHYEYGVWGTGHNFVKDPSMAWRINMGMGIEVADEGPVCAAIAQEFMNSPTVVGLWLNDRGGSNGQGEPEEGYFGIEREMSYTTGKRRKVDFFIQKDERKNPNRELTEAPKPSFIEAKRARIWTPRLKTGTAKKCKRKPQIKRVRNDIEKLRKEKEKRKKDGCPIHCHLLVWGIRENGCKDTDDPVEYFCEVDDPKVELHQIRWLPVEWTVPKFRNVKNGVVRLPTVKRSLWVALAEVDPGS